LGKTSPQFIEMGSNSLFTLSIFLLNLWRHALVLLFSHCVIATSLVVLFFLARTRVLKCKIILAFRWWKLMIKLDSKLWYHAWANPWNIIERTLHITSLSYMTSFGMLFTLYMLSKVYESIILSRLAFANV